MRTPSAPCEPPTFVLPPSRLVGSPLHHAHRSPYQRGPPQQLRSPSSPFTRHTPRISCRVADTPRVAGGGMAPSSEKFSQYDGQDLSDFCRLASEPGVRMVPLWKRIFSDQLTPVVAFRCLVPDSDVTTPSFLLESVHTVERIGRYSLLGARPVREVLAYAHDVTVKKYEHDIPSTEKMHCEDPWELIREMSMELKPSSVDNLPGGTEVFAGGWVGYGGYDTVRYTEERSIPFTDAPMDDRGLPDLHFGLYRDVVVFDQVTKEIYIVHWVDLASFGSPTSHEQLVQVQKASIQHLDGIVDILTHGVPLTPLASGRISLNTCAAAKQIGKSNMTKEQFMTALKQIHHHLCVGDTFQTVFSQRFERWSEAEPFSVYRALRIINPSPYMIYMQCEGSVLIASSPEILTKVIDGVLTNRPLAGTRRRGTTSEEDNALAQDLEGDGKDRSEHMMLVDLGRNDVGKVAEYGSVTPVKVMEVERYSHVMHLSSTVTGILREGLSSWDALKSTLPAGTVSGAPKIRAMQIIDSLEPTKRGPYGGGIGWVSFSDNMNIALALRTMVIPTNPRISDDGRKEWMYHLQAGAGIVFESDPEGEYTETINKAMAMKRAIDLAESAFD